ncbi:hypothetical protein C8R44DRAFT_786883 [Mycena epipterygia]|nr:hypothetical protein C8R44DRAFT_786883 [Mycena epipterygia]
MPGDRGYGNLINIIVGVAAIIGTIVAGIAVVIGIPVLLAKAAIQRNLAIDEELHSKITALTPISGFYGPGAWWGWLITLGMTHVHTLRRVGAHHLRQEWDYDLIAASCYAIAASIDLILKSRAIAQLGEKASESVLLPALVCAERVVSVGIGSSLFSAASGLLTLRLRTVGIATITFMFALVASGFSLRAHQVISQTAPVFWCSLHGENMEKRYDDLIFNLIPVFPFTLVDVPAHGLVLMGTSFVMPGYWTVAGMASGLAIPLVFVGSMVQQRNLGRALWFATLGGLASGVVFLLIQIFVACLVTGMFAGFWLCFWLVLWCPIYIVAFFPLMGYFPLTGISVLEMDQGAALLGVVAVAAMRTLGPVFSALRVAADSDSTSSHELEPLLSGRPSSDQ